MAFRVPNESVCSNPKGRPSNKSVGTNSQDAHTLVGFDPALVNISASAPPKSELRVTLRTTDVGTSPPLD